MPLVAMETLEITSRIGVFAVTGILFGVMCLAYRRMRTPRMLWVASSFGLFFVGGIVLLLEVLSDQANALVSEGLNYSVTLAALVLLAVALLRGR